ncbi:MAG: hypothetical protein IJR02_14690 [Bacteroidaceae bacterium]|nr:hypothetical protein [Bacteroidaceae bacterium]MBQ6751995.1 hypothetical protein [Bacteroidaceae bacterium]
MVPGHENGWGLWTVVRKYRRIDIGVSACASLWGSKRCHLWPWEHDIGTRTGAA